MNKFYYAASLLLAIVLFITILQLTGCANVVKVPISQPCVQVKRESIPVTPLATINDKSSIAEVMQAFAQDSKIQHEYNRG